MRGCVACLVLCLPFVVPCVSLAGKSQAEDVVAKMLGQLEKMADALTSMKDEETSAAAREGLKKHVAAFRELRAQADKMSPPSREVKDRIEKEYKKKIIKVQERLMLEVTRVRATVPGGRMALTEVSELLLGKESKTSPPKEKDEEKK